MARPAAGGLGFPEVAQILRDDHSEAIWRAGIFGLRPFGSDPQIVVVLDLRGGHRHGAELAWPGRTAAAIRHQGAAGLLAAAARSRRGNSLLRPDQPGSGLGRRLDDRFRRGLPRHLRGPRDHRHPAQLAQALHHARADRDRAGACFQASRSRSPDRQPRRHRHHARSGADQSARRQHRPASSAGHAGFPERAELGPRRLHPDRQRHRRRRSGRQGLEDADERAGGGPRHFAAVIVGGGRGVFRPRHRRLCAHPRAIPCADRKIRGDPGAARPHRRHRLSARCARGA